jgi:hypothetical protein
MAALFLKQRWGEDHIKIRKRIRGSSRTRSVRESVLRISRCSATEHEIGTTDKRLERSGEVWAKDDESREISCAVLSEFVRRETERRDGDRTRRSRRSASSSRKESWSSAPRRGAGRGVDLRKTRLKNDLGWSRAESAGEDEKKRDLRKEKGERRAVVVILQLGGYAFHSTLNNSDCLKSVSI